MQSLWKLITNWTQCSMAWNGQWSMGFFNHVQVYDATMLLLCVWTGKRAHFKLKCQKIISKTQFFMKSTPSTEMSSSSNCSYPIYVCYNIDNITTNILLNFFVGIFQQHLLQCFSSFHFVLFDCFVRNKIIGTSGFYGLLLSLANIWTCVNFRYFFLEIEIR